MNPVISKTSKVHIFTESSLKQLGQLYNWKGPERWKDADQKKTEADIEVKCYCHTLCLDIICRHMCKPEMWFTS